MSVRIDLTGKRFGRLTVIRLEVDTPGKKKKWLCRCDCGNEVIVQGGNLQSGHSTQCKKCQIKEAVAGHATHMHTKTRLYYIWANMITRCENSKDRAYCYYGGRGISVCEEWHNADVFIKWALKNGYKEDLTIDRIDVNGNYEPSNCRWADLITQMNNMRNNRYITHNGETHTAAEWARYYEVDYKYLIGKLERGFSLIESVEAYRKYKSKKVKGVHKNRNRYYARITINKEVHNLGGFDTYEEAVGARKQAELKYLGMTEEEAAAMVAEAKAEQEPEEERLFGEE